MGADDLGMLTAIGLTLNFVGAIVLLGSDVERVEHVLKRIDPVHHAYKSGLIRIIDESMVEGIEDDNRVFHMIDRCVLIIGACGRFVNFYDIRWGRTYLVMLKSIFGVGGSKSMEKS